jgi:hypothetical protein
MRSRVRDALVPLGGGDDGLELAGGLEVGGHQLDSPIGLAGERRIADLMMLLVGARAHSGLG